MVHFKQLKNGIRLIVKQMSGLMSVSMGIIVHTGAAAETERQDGISHFIEHMLFKGTKKRSACAISDEMDAIGAQVNAFTAKDNTCYYCKSTTTHAAEAFEILSDLFLNSTFPEDEMVREKGVIIEEINMNEDTPDDLCLDLLSEACFGRGGYGRNILGPRKNVEGFTKEAVDEYMSERYTADNIVIAMAGNIDVALADDLVERYFSSLPPKTGKKFEVAPEYKSQKLFKTKDIEQVHIGLAFPSVKRYDPLYDATTIMNSVFGGSMSSRLFQTVREKMGLAYTVYSFVSCYAETGMLAIYAGVNSEKYMQSVDAICDCIDKFTKKDMSKDEFLRGREQLLASAVFAQENTGSQMLLYGKELLYSGKIYDFEERVKIISSVSFDDVMSAVDVNFKGEAATAVVGGVDKPIQ